MSLEKKVCQKVVHARNYVQAEFTLSIGVSSLQKKQKQNQKNIERENVDSMNDSEKSSEINSAVQICCSVVFS